MIECLRYEAECHLRPESLCQVTLFSVEVQYLVSDTINMLLKVDLVYLEHLGARGDGVTLIEGQ